MKNNISAIFIVCLFLMMVSCKTKDPKTIYVPVESVKTEWRDRYIKDSIHTKDSVIIIKDGDTIKIRETRYVYQKNVVRDSIDKYVGIKIPIPYEVKETVYVDKPDSWLDKTQKYIARFGLALLAIFLLVKYRSNIFKLIRKWVFKV